MTRPGGEESQNEGNQVKLVRKIGGSPPDGTLLLSCLRATALTVTLYLLKLMIGCN